MKNCLRLLIILMLGMTTSCMTIQDVQTWKNPQADLSQRISYKFGEFKNTNSKHDLEEYPEAKQIMQEALETALLRSGFQIITEGEADAIISGTVREYYRGSFGDRYTTVGFDIKATDVGSGEMMWKASHSITTKWDYKYSPSLLANRVAQELAASLRIK